MKVMVIGAGRLGAKVIAQLRKNERIEIVVADPNDRPEALRLGLIERIDITDQLTPMNIEDVVRRVRPDVILLSRTLEDWGQNENLMGFEYVKSMERELLSIGVPVIPVCGITFPI